MRNKLYTFLVCIPVLALVACEQPKQFSPSKDLPEPDSEGAKVLMDFCSQCHAPPKPSTHLKGEWRNVVLRMQNHRLMESMDTLSEQQIASLVAYLDKHASEF
ncbi:MAG: cytochrome c [Gammaproteobacteria bacterium]|nr:cytochrome c [Gammaproteobacteria bacterium]